MNRSLCVALVVPFLASCNGVVYGTRTETVITIEDRVVLMDFANTIDRVSNMVSDYELQSRATERGLNLVNVAWEDTGRAVGSALGPNITDLTLQVRRRLWNGEWADALMPVVRFPNFSDRTADIPADRFFLRVGNAQNAPLKTMPLLDVLRDLCVVSSKPNSLGSDLSKPINLAAERDTHFLVSAQAVFLPIPRSGQATFHPVVFNYQSAPGSPAVLVLLATREGTSVKVIENRTEDVTVDGWGQELYFNEHGSRSAFTAERRSDVKSRIDAQGGPRTEADRSALGQGADILALIQVPLRHANRGPLGGLPDTGMALGGPSYGGSGKGNKDDGYGYEFSDDPLAAGGFGPSDATIRVRPGPVRTGDVERAVLGHGPRLGLYQEGYGSQLVRDERLPIRVTIQFYKSTSDGIASDADLDGIAKSIANAYEHADYVGSLVIPPGDSHRPTAWQSMPKEWFPW
jgi:hypothetical protein